MKKIKYSNLFILGIFIYIIFYAASSVIGKNIQIRVLENEKTDMKISRKCLIVRDEYLLKSSIDGTVNLLADEGDRVIKSQDVVNIYSNNIEQNIDTSISSLNGEIEKMKDGEVNISKNDINDFNIKIESTFSEMQVDLLEKDYSNIKEYKETLDSYINDKNRLLSNDIDSVKLSSKEEQKKILENQRENNVQTYSSNIAGIVSYKFDGKEDKYNYSSLEKIGKNDIEREVNKYEKVSSNLDKVKEGSVILRVINNYDTYVVTDISKEEVNYFEENQPIKLCSGEDEIEGTVHKIYKENNDFMVIFKINNQNVGIYDTRVKEFDIIYKQIEGLKIPKSSIKTVDNKDGVYVVNEESKTSEFIELKGITYEDKSFEYINYYKNKIDGVNTVDLYDKIILKPNIINTKMKIE